MVKPVKAGKIVFGGGAPLVLIAGPCVIEDEGTVMRIAERLSEMTGRLGIPFVFKASYDKANRTSVTGFRGPGIDDGLRILSDVKTRFGVPILSDVHSPEEVAKAARVLDVLQIPAFLCRQTDLLAAAARSGRVVNIKKGQFLAPWDMRQAAAKVTESGNDQVLLTERGSSFGYNTLVTDFRSLPIMREIGFPVILDASHSVQKPGGLGSASGGNSEYIPLMARCGAAAGCDGIFMEVHENPEKALSDGPNMLSLDRLEDVLRDVQVIDALVKQRIKE